MAQTKNSPTLKNVTTVAYGIAKERGISILEVTAKDIIDVMGKGSDGYLSAHLQTLKCEYLASKCFEAKDGCVSVMASVNNLIDDCVKKAEERIRAEAKVTQELFDEVCKKNADLYAELAAREQELVTLRNELATQLQTLNEELIKLRDENQQLRMSRDLAEKGQKDAVAQLHTVQHDLGAAQTKLARAEADCATADREKAALQKSVEQEREERKKAEKEAANSDKLADLSEWKRRHAESENAKLKEEVAVLLGREAAALAQLELLKNQASMLPKKASLKPSEQPGPN